MLYYATHRQGDGTPFPSRKYVLHTVLSFSKYRLKWSKGKVEQTVVKERDLCGFSLVIKVNIRKVPVILRTLDWMEWEWIGIYLCEHFNGQKPILTLRNTINKQKTRQTIKKEKKNKKKAKLKDILLLAGLRDYVT